MLGLPDPALIERKKKLFVDAELQRAVDFKVFSLCAELIDGVAGEDALREASLFLQPRHVDEVVEERCNNGLCGNVRCGLSLSLSLSASRPRSSSSHHGPRYRVEYKTKRVFEVNEAASRFCSALCFEQSERWKGGLDTTMPYSRPAARDALREREKDKEKEKEIVKERRDIDELLALFSRGEDDSSARERQRQRETASERERDALAPPPLFATRGISERGEVENVQFEPGLPLVRETKRDTEREREREREKTKTLRFAEQLVREKETESESESDEPVDAVYLPASHHTTPSHNAAEVVSERETETVRETEREHAAPAELAALLRGMQALQSKYDAPLVFAPKKSASTAARAERARETEREGERETETSITTRVVREKESETQSETERETRATPPLAPLPAEEREREKDTLSAERQQSERESADEAALLQSMRGADEQAEKEKKKIRRRAVRRVADWAGPAAPPAPHVVALSVSPSLSASGPGERESNESNSDVVSLAAVESVPSAAVLAVPAAPAPAAAASVAPKSILKKNYKPIPKVQPLLAMSINEKPHAVPLSAAALLSKREPTAIEGYVPDDVYYLED